MKKIHTIGHYQRGCFYIFRTENSEDFKTAEKLIKDTYNFKSGKNEAGKKVVLKTFNARGCALLFQFLCARLDIVFVTPDNSTFQTKLKEYGK